MGGMSLGGLGRWALVCVAVRAAERIVRVLEEEPEPAHALAEALVLTGESVLVGGAVERLEPVTARAETASRVAARSSVRELAQAIVLAAQGALAAAQEDVSRADVAELTRESVRRSVSAAAMAAGVAAARKEASGRVDPYHVAGDLASRAAALDCEVLLAADLGDGPVPAPLLNRPCWPAQVFGKSASP